MGHEETGARAESGGDAVDVADARRAAVELVRAQRLESMAALAGAVAHDFNNLLTRVNGYAELVLGELEPASPARDDVQQILTAGRRAGVLAGRLLAFAQRAPMALSELDLGALVDAQAAALRPDLGASVALVVIPPEAPLFVRADPAVLERVMATLVQNARDAMPRGGTVTLHTAVREVVAAGGPLAPEAGRHAVLSVGDTGAGMSADALAHLFEPFYTTKPKSVGAGLGLAVAFGAVRQSGGQLRVESEPDRGSVFEVWLPVVDAVRGASASSRAPAPAVCAPRCVLLVDDEPAVREIGARALRAAGFEVVQAADGEEALALFRARPEAFAILVTDAVMPRLGGVALVAAARACRPALPALLVSGYLEGPGLGSAAGEPPTFLAKPFAQADLVRCVRDLVERAT